MGLVNTDGSFVRTETAWDEEKGEWVNGVSSAHGVEVKVGGPISVEALPESIPEAVAPEVVKQDRIASPETAVKKDRKAYKRSYMREYMRKRRALKEKECTVPVS